MNLLKWCKSLQKLRWRPAKQLPFILPFLKKSHLKEFSAVFTHCATQRAAHHLAVFTGNVVKCTWWSAKYIQSLKRARPIRANHFHISRLRTEDALQEQHAKLFFLMLIIPPSMFVSLSRHGNYVKNTKILDQLPCLQTCKSHNPDGQQQIQNVWSGRKKEENWRLCVIMLRWIVQWGVVFCPAVVNCRCALYIGFCLQSLPKLQMAFIIWSRLFKFSMF